jgi:transposase
LFLSGTSMRKIAQRLRISRNRVRRTVREHRRQRAEGVVLPELEPKGRRPSLLDPHAETIRQLLDRYPDITAVRLHEELVAKGFEGGYTTVKERLRELRPRSPVEPVVRFETAPGKQGQVDYSPYDIDFTEEGRRRVHAFSCVLGYSRYQYLNFVEDEKFITTIREHVAAFNSFGGVPATNLYDQMKVVVLRVVDDVPLLNARFLAFATHYGFRPWICRKQRPQTKGKVERPFLYAETNLLNGRTFRTLAHLNEVTAWWLRERANVRDHRETKRRPVDMFAEERPHLIPLPGRPYDTSEVVYRTVDAEGRVWMDGNTYSVPWQRIGELVALQITEHELIVYSSIDIREIARHVLLPPWESGERVVDKAHLPDHDQKRRYEKLHERFAELGDAGTHFLEGLVQTRYGKSEACRVLALLSSYRKADLRAALQRASRYKAFGFKAVERILAAIARPLSVMESLAGDARDQLEDLTDLDDAVPPRPASEYQALVEDSEEEADGQG